MSASPSLAVHAHCSKAFRANTNLRVQRPCRDASEPRPRTLPNCLFSSASDRSSRIIPHCPPRLTTSDGRLVRAHCSPRHCIHSLDFLAVKVSPALLILFINIVLLLKNCISVINPQFVFVSLFVRARCVYLIRNVLYFKGEILRQCFCLNI